MLDLVTLVAIASAFVSVGGAVFTVLFARRGSDADVKTDLAELAMLVDRMAKANRREKMARVRNAAKEETRLPADPALQGHALDYAQDPKTALRAKVAQINAQRS